MPYTIGIDARKLQDFGIGTYIRNLVYGLAEIDQENNYVLFAGAQRRDALGDLPENFRIVTERSPVYSIRELLALSWKLFRLDLDLYHATHYVLPAINTCRVVVTIHDIIHLLYPEYLPNRLAFFYAQRMIRRSLARGDRILTVSKNTRSDLMRYFDVDGEKIQAIYNGVDDAFRAPVPTPDLDRWLKNLDIPRPYLLFVGNPKPHKNLENVLRAYAQALKTHAFDGPLVCVGDRGNSEFKLRQIADQLGIGDRLLLLGHVAQEALPAIYQGATLFLYPTLYEGFGLPVVEAMASGVAVITSNNSALKEVAEGYAHLVNPLDVDGIAQAIAHCMEDEDHRAALAKLGRRRASDFQWKRTAEQTLEAYLQTIRQHEGSGSKGSSDRGPAARNVTVDQDLS
ncbi:MAG: glycosyltransferase family 4 protein [Deltaproteobacteria bacterium]|nr:glycosyltransferase family 4 protein [Deltaproteobacteria bacterium]